MENHKAVTFKRFSGDEQHSIGVCRIPWKLGRHTEYVEVYVVPRNSDFLLSNPLLKRLGCNLDMENDELVFRKLGVRVQLQTTKGGHYEVQMDGSTVQPLADPDGARSLTKAPAGPREATAQPHFQ